MILKYFEYKGTIFLLALQIGLLCSCGDNDQKNKRNTNKSDLESSIKLDGKDLNIVYYCLQKAIKSDTTFSETKCAENIKFYDEKGLVILRKNLQHCLADLRWTWRWDIYYNQKEEIILKIVYDGLDNILEVVHN